MKTLLALTMAALMAYSAASETRVYFGTYTRGKDSEGIYMATLDLEKGKLSEAKLVAKADNPSFLALTSDGSHLLAVEETGDYEGKASGALVSFAIDSASGSLEPKARIATRGGAPCHVTLDSAGRHAFWANYVGGSIGAAAIGADGSLTETAFVQHKGAGSTPRQSSPHAHSVDLDPTGGVLVAADLGLDKVLAYRFDSGTGKLTVNDPPFAATKEAGGPRHFAFRPDGKFGYTNLEITSEVSAVSYDAKTGAMDLIQTLSTLPDGFEGRNSTAELIMHPGGRFVYCSNRGHDSVAVFESDAKTGKLTKVEVEVLGVQTPRGVGIDPTGRYLVAAGQNNGEVRVFGIDPATGALSPTGSMIKVPSAVSVQFFQTAGDYVSIFDGKSTEGWEGDMEWFRVEDGCIVAGTQEKKIPKNQFLVTEKEYNDFELRFKAKLVGKGNNAGVQIWSQRIPDHHEMIGFQCDIGDMRGVSIWGALYDESRRRKFLTQVPLATRQQTKLKDEWNEFRVRCEGDSITIWVNGCLATRYFEHGPKADIPRNGRIGLQIHSGAPLEAWYKDIEVKEL